MVEAERLEARGGDAGEALWDAEAWWGSNLNRWWLKSEGTLDSSGNTESAELQALFSRAVAAFWDLQAGLRHEFAPGPRNTTAVVGLHGTLPFNIEVDAAAFVGGDASLAARLEAARDLRLTRRLVLQPRIEVEAARDALPEGNVGSGITEIEAGLRLHWELQPDLAPYAGLEYEAAVGDTRNRLKATGQDSAGWTGMIGLRFWF